MQTLELVTLQEHRDAVYKEMVSYREKVNQYKEIIILLEEEKEEIITTQDSFPKKSPFYFLEVLAKAMPDLSIREIEVEMLKMSATQKDQQISTLDNLLDEKNTLISKVQIDRDEA